MELNSIKTVLRITLSEPEIRTEAMKSKVKAGTAPAAS